MPLPPLSLSLVAIVAVVAPSAAASPPSVIRLVSITTSESSVDVPPRKASAGDRQLFASRLLNARRQFGKPKGAVVGSDRGTMTLTSATSAHAEDRREAAGRHDHRRRAAAGRPATGPSRSPVVSGTGVFAGAHGTLTILAPTGPKTAVNVYRLSYGPIA